VFIVIVVSIFGCKKEAVPSQNGANTMSAKVKGNKWSKKSCFSCIGGGSGLTVNYDDINFFGISGQNNDQNITVTFVIKSLKSTGVYELGSEENNFAQVYNNNEKISYYTSSLSTGKVIVTKLDLANKIISGTFEFIAADKNNSVNKVSVTSGNFDVTYQ
jgi:hypothetical protein